MTSTKSARPSKADSRRPALDRRTAMRLAAREYDLFSAALDGVAADQWTLPTDCPGWDVRALGCHVLGMAAMAASVREGTRQRKEAGRRGGVFIDALTAVQVEERSALAAQQLKAQLHTMGPRAARGRRRTPGFLRKRPMPVPQTVGGVAEWWTLGYLIDVVLTRDPWMHRVDLSRAVGQPMQLTADHDGVIVADVVAEWAGRHGQPYTLHLTGAAGGTWAAGSGGPKLELDALEFCRTLSGRSPGEGLLAIEVPF
jgi:uncharacterized protein (TIGR03083 family)